MVAAEPRPIGRLRLLLKLHELGDRTTFEAIFGEVEQLERGEDEDRWAPYYLLKEAAQLDPERTSAALVRRLTAGDTLGSGWDAFVFHATPEDRQGLTGGILNGLVPVIERETVARLLGSPEIGQLIVQLLSTSDATTARRPLYPAELGETYHDLQRILQSCQFPALTQAIVQMPPLSDARHAGVLADVLAGYGGHEQREQRLLLPEDLLRNLRERLHAWINLIQSSVDGRRGQLADMAVTFGRLGQREDLPLLQQLLEADLSRRRRERDTSSRVAGGNRGRPSLIRLVPFSTGEPLKRCHLPASPTLSFLISRIPTFRRRQPSSFAMSGCENTARLRARRSGRDGRTTHA